MKPVPRRLECADDQSCIADCEPPEDFNQDDVQLLADYASCLATECTLDCTYDVSGGGGSGSSNIRTATSLTNQDDTLTIVGLDI